MVAGGLSATREALSQHPIVLLLTKPSELRTYNREQLVALIMIPIFSLGLIITGGIVGATSFQQDTASTASEEELRAATAINPEPNLEKVVAEPEEFHSIARYLGNVEEYRETIGKLTLKDDLQMERVAEVLGWLEVRQWEFVGGFEGDTCYRNGDRVECVDTEMFENLRTNGEAYAVAHPEGSGLCYDWFDDVCMSGEWFDNRTSFDGAIADTVNYVLTGSQASEETAKNLESSPIYEPSRSATISDPDFFSANEWETITRVLFPDRTRGDLRVTPNEKGEGFCIGSKLDGDCFASKEALNKAEAELREAYRDGACSGWATGSNGVSVCTAIWVGNWPNHKNMSLGEAICDNNTGTCKLIPNTNRACQFNCSLSPTPQGPAVNSPSRQCFWEDTEVDCAQYDDWLANNSFPYTD